MTIKNGIVAAAFALTFAGTASADVVTMKFVETGAGQNIKFKLNGGSEKSVFAGQLRHTITGGTGIGADWAGDHLLFCTDIYEYVSKSSKSFEIIGLEDAPNSVPMGADKAQAIYDVYNAFGGATMIAGIDNEFAAAFQIAVWEIVTDFNADSGLASLDLGTGNFKVTKVNGKSARTATFNDYLSDIFGAIGSGSSAGVVALSNNGAQDQLFVIPAPGSVALAGSGLLMLGRRRRA